MIRIKEKVENILGVLGELKNKCKDLDLSKGISIDVYIFDGECFIEGKEDKIRIDSTDILSLLTDMKCYLERLNNKDGISGNETIRIEIKQ